MAKKGPAGKPGKTPTAAKPLAPSGKPSALLDTRVVYRGDCPEQIKNLPDAFVDPVRARPRWRPAATATLVLCFACALALEVGPALGAAPQVVVVPAEPKRSAAEIGAMEAKARAAGGDLAVIAPQLAKVGHEYYRGEHYEQSARVFKELSEQEGADFPERIRLDSLRMLGQIALFINRDTAAAEKAYGRMLELGLELPEADRGPTVGEAAEKLAIVYQTTENYAKSVEVRQKLLDSGHVESSRRQYALLENARDLVRLKRYSDAVKAYETFLREYPEYGKTDGTVINVKHEWVGAHGYERLDPQRAALLQKMWEDPANRDYLQIFNIARETVSLADAARDYKTSEAVGTQLLEVLDQRWAKFDAQAISKFGLDSTYHNAAVLVASAMGRRGDPQGAIKMLERLLERVPNIPQRADVEAQIREFQKH